MYWVKAGVSDREARGFRGPVRSIVEERTYPDPTAADGSGDPKRDSFNTTEFDVAGRLRYTNWRNPDGSEWATRHSYEASGRLRKSASRMEGKPAQETVFSYDDRGRLLAIAFPGSGKNPTTFQYDERGRKTKVEVSLAEDYRANVGINGESPFWAADRAPNFPDGGSANTMYDELDRPVEVVVRNAGGEVVSRALRIYDPQGNISEEKNVTERITSFFPPDAWERLLKDSGLSREELRQQIETSLPPQVNEHFVSCEYDERERMIRLRRRVFGGDEAKEMTYNDHGDKITEITRSTRFAEKLEVGAAMKSEYSEARYIYKYDDRGNWLEQQTTYRWGTDGEFKRSTRTRRTITYFEENR